MFLDTNVLVRARFGAAPNHDLARKRMQEAGKSGEVLRISRQVLREYLATVTRPQPDLPAVDMDDALDHIAALEARFEILEEGPKVTAMLKQLCREVRVAGQQVHDANIVATMLTHGERKLMTFDSRHFKRYGKRIALVGIAGAP